MLELVVIVMYVCIYVCVYVLILYRTCTSPLCIVILCWLRRDVVKWENKNITKKLLSLFLLSLLQVHISCLYLHATEKLSRIRIGLKE